MKTRTLKLYLTEAQCNKISKFVCKMKGELNTNGYGLISQPRVFAEQLDIMFIIPQELDSIREIFKKLKLLKQGGGK